MYRKKLKSKKQNNRDEKIKSKNFKVAQNIKIIEIKEGIHPPQKDNSIAKCHFCGVEGIIVEKFKSRIYGIRKYDPPNKTSGGILKNYLQRIKSNYDPGR